MAKKEEWVNPRIIDFNLSKWDEGEMIHYISFYNGLYIGCAIKNSEITYLDVARTVLDIELTKKMYSSRLSKLKCTFKDKTVTFYISGRRVEVTYALPR
jgi:hypothetical protein